MKMESKNSEIIRFSIAAFYGKEPVGYGILNDDTDRDIKAGSVFIYKNDLFIDDGIAYRNFKTFNIFMEEISLLELSFIDAIFTINHRRLKFAIKPIFDKEELDELWERFLKTNKENFEQKLSETKKKKSFFERFLNICPKK